MFTVIITSTSVLVIIAVYLDTTDVEKVYAYILQAVAGGVLGKRFDGPYKYIYIEIGSSYF